jgi:hypothetical protein
VPTHPETAQFKPLPREGRAAPALDTQIHVEYGADRERLLASSRTSGILPTTFRIAVLPIGKRRRVVAEPQADLEVQH